MSPGLQFDEKASRSIAATYTTPDIVEQRRLLRAELGLRGGEAALDVGSGPGLLACEMAREIGKAGSVRGVDPSDSMLAIARAEAPGSDAAPVTFVGGDACALPFAEDSFDVVVSTQVYEYVAEIGTALTEATRVLRPGGRLAILDTDWDSIVWHSSDPARMRRVLAEWDQHLVDPYLPRRLPRLLREAGLTVTRQTIIPLLNSGYDVDTYSAGLIGFITGFLAGRKGASQVQSEAWAEDLVGLGEDYFFSLNRYLFVAVKPA